MIERFKETASVVIERFKETASVVIERFKDTASVVIDRFNETVSLDNILALKLPRIIKSIKFVNNYY